jgi:hypothetical protein
LAEPGDAALGFTDAVGDANAVEGIPQKVQAGMAGGPGFDSSDTRHTLEVLRRHAWDRNFYPA